MLQYQFLSCRVKMYNCYTVHMFILDPILEAHIQHADPLRQIVIIMCEVLFLCVKHVWFEMILILIIMIYDRRLCLTVSSYKLFLQIFFTVF